MNLSKLRKLANTEKHETSSIPIPHWHEGKLKSTEAEYATGQIEVLDWQEAKQELRQRFERYPEDNKSFIHPQPQPGNYPT